MKKQWMTAALILLALALALLGTVPVYPAFEKEASSMDGLKRALRREPFLYPDDMDLRDAAYWLELDDRSLLASPVGYRIERRKDGSAVVYPVSGSTRRPSPSSPEPLEKIEYRGVEIGLWTCGDPEDAAPFAELQLSFSLDGLHYALKAAVHAEKRSELAADAKQLLLTQCRLMIDSAADT